MRIFFFIFFLLLLVACKYREAEKQIVPVGRHDHTENGLQQDVSRWPARFGWGRRASTKEIAAEDIDVRPDGSGLPPGSGNAVSGAMLYANKCAACHGQPAGINAKTSVAPLLFAHPDSLHTKTIGNYWPYASTVFDYVSRTMPYNAPGSLSDNEVYALTAYLLFANGIIDSVTVLTDTNLAKIKMPAEHRFIKDDRHGGPEIK